ncbi:HD domain-containing protein [Guptibacillus algicola]|uniref:HD domain-containing protein n=1 Tax=Guptibacillus algicola TaxID=225844 RepID=UPI001CD19B72|nr:HD domain-containing protein [Alkalihalobacillus algicola]MCA0987584.1 HD domain-containing protein [Alkalihalobacillus algicola]
MDAKEIITFIKELERLKDTTRSAYTKKGRRESVAEHSWRLAMFALALSDELKSLDMNKVISMCLVHDLGEAYDGDISATVKVNHDKKVKKEEKGVERLTDALPPENQDAILALCKEYNKGETDEAKFVKALDKMETIIQHTQGTNPPGFDYTFNLTYGKEYELNDPLMKKIRKLIDLETKKKIDDNTP